MTLWQCNKLCNFGGRVVRRFAPAKPHNRAGIWYLVRRVPGQFAELDRRGIVRLTTDIAVVDDPRLSRQMAVERPVSDRPQPAAPNGEV